MYDDSGKLFRDSSYRRSKSSKLPRRDETVQRLEARAKSLPFYSPDGGDFMPMVVQNYDTRGLYRNHFDWFDDTQVAGGNIASTFFVYVLANCTGGGTNFPMLEAPEDESWCEFVDCDRPLDEGVTFLPVVGNAIYWENLNRDGSGHLKTLHAGMPVTSGNKMGLNMWTWKGAKRNRDI
jgi:prolyl 4-hydroxylase